MKRKNYHFLVVEVVVALAVLLLLVLLLEVFAAFADAEVTSGEVVDSATVVDLAVVW